MRPEIGADALSGKLIDYWRKGRPGRHGQNLIVMQPVSQYRVAHDVNAAVESEFL
jgi:hypothetical protein